MPELDRSTRGKRLKQLVGEELEADETFWSQSVWNEEDDASYDTEEERPDIFDSDFDVSESEENEDEVTDDENRKPREAQKRKYFEPGLKQKHKRDALKKSIKKKLEATINPESTKSVSQIEKEKKKSQPKIRVKNHLEDQNLEDDLSRRKVRNSTLQKSKTSQEMQEKEAAKHAKLKQTVHPKVVQKFTQEQLLIEAVHTETENMKWLLKMQRMAEENENEEGAASNKKKLVNTIKFLSRRGCYNTITFPSTENMPKILSNVRVLGGGTRKKK